MIPRIHSAELVQTPLEEMWIIYFHVPEQPRFAQVRMVPVGQPKTCPGGMWCKDFGCVPGKNVFTEAEPEILVEVGTNDPSNWEEETLEWGQFVWDNPLWKEDLLGEVLDDDL